MSFVFSKNCVHAKDVLSSLYELKVDKKFCDVVLVVDNHEVKPNYSFLLNFNYLKRNIYLNYLACYS